MRDNRLVVVGDDLSGYDTIPACENQYRTTIASKAALIVVDDVWSKADIEPLGFRFARCDLWPQRELRCQIKCELLHLMTTLPSSGEG